MNKQSKQVPDNPELKIAAIRINQLHAEMVVNSLLSIVSIGIKATLEGNGVDHREQLINLGKQHGITWDTEDNSFLTETGDFLTKNSTENAHAAATSAALVFAHSVADASLHDLCQLVAHQDPSRWRDLVNAKKVSIQDVANSSSQEVLSGVVTAFVQQLERESILKKTDMLIHVLSPSSTDAQLLLKEFDRTRLAQLDVRRHECVHSRQFSTSNGSIQSDLASLRDTIDLFIRLVCMTLGFKDVGEEVNKAFPTTQ